MSADWTPEEVAKRLEAIGLGKYGERFIAQEIGGSALGDLTNDHCRELGLTIGARLRLRAWVRGLGTLGPKPDPASPDGTVERPPCGFCQRRFHPDALRCHQRSCPRRPDAYKPPPFRLHKGGQPSTQAARVLRALAKSGPARGPPARAVRRQEAARRACAPFSRPGFDSRAQRLRETGAEYSAPAEPAPPVPKKDFRKEHTVLCELIRLSRRLARLQTQES
jgi:hypothetical protein